jgi:hypothetical protein
MKMAKGIFVLVIILSLTGCTSLVDSIIHATGGISERDVKIEMFQKYISARTNQIILIKSTVWGYNYPDGIYYTDAMASQQRAFSILSDVIQYYKTTDATVNMSLAVLETMSPSKVLYAISKDNVPVYLHSSIFGPAKTQSAISKENNPKDVVPEEAISVDNPNILSLTTIIQKQGNFPFELTSMEIHPDEDINDLQALSMARKKDKDWHAKTTAEYNQHVRSAYKTAVSVLWPKLLDNSTADADILYISWEEYKVSFADQMRDTPRRVGLSLIPFGLGRRVDQRGHLENHTKFKCSRINAKDGAVYYYKTYNYNGIANTDHVISELRRMSELYNQSLKSPKMIN